MRSILSRKAVVLLLVVLTLPFFFSKFTGMHRPLGAFRDAFDDWPRNMSFYSGKSQPDFEESVASDSEDFPLDKLSWRKPAKQTAKGALIKWQGYAMPETELLVHAPGKHHYHVVVSSPS